MLGIDDPMVWLAYVGCIAITLVCLLYGALRRNAAGDKVSAEDRVWAVEEKKVSDER